MVEAGYEIALVHLDGQAEIRLVGEFDLAAAPDLRRELLSRLTASIPVEVDMRAVTFMDSSTVGVFIHAHKLAAEKGTTFRLVNVTGSCSEVLEITGLTQLLVDDPEARTV